MPQHIGFSAWITIDDAVATEYATRILEETNKVECWIASEVGKRFKIHFRPIHVVHPSPRRLSAKVFLDGVLAGMRYVNWSSFLDAIYVSTTEVRDIVFSRLNLTDDDKHRDASVNASYGEIRVEIWETTDLGHTVVPTVPIMASQIVHEASKKAGVHRVGLGGQSRKSEAPCQAVSFNQLLTTFIFYYKPLAVLQAHEIAPRPPRRSPSPVPVASPSRGSPQSDGDGEPDDEYNRLQAQIQELQARADAISKAKRPAPNAEAGPSAKRVKKEPIVVPVSLRGEVIDLTMDD